MTLSLSRKGLSELSSSRKGLRELFFAMLALGGMAAATTGCQVRVVDPEVAVVPYRSDLVYVRPGVYVVADSDVAVYYVDGRYYYVDNGSWYSRRHPHDHWVVVNYGYVPHTIVSLDHTRYVRLPRAHGSVAHHDGHHHPRSYHTEPRSLHADPRGTSEVRVAETGTHAGRSRVSQADRDGSHGAITPGARFDVGSPSMKGHSAPQPATEPASLPPKGQSPRVTEADGGPSVTSKASSSSPSKARKLKRSRKPASDRLTAR